MKQKMMEQKHDLKVERTARQQLGALNVPISALDVIDE